jgi:hypothetical protein
MLKELYSKGPEDAFYVVKVWVRGIFFYFDFNILFCRFIAGQYGLSRKYCEYISLFISVKY